ncbi:MAG TPA: DUF2169 domain-containing protein [Acidobacteriota bacterium]|nr:DUF2169 domain-containing protein [Acidobacteriota bacterium]
MWQVENATPFAAAGNWIRDREGAEVWLVAVRCTFGIRSDGTTVVTDEQEPPVLAPVYRGDPATTSLLKDSDFYLTKPTTDVLLHGHAYAPGGNPATDVEVTLRLGAVSKTLRVIGDRVYEEGIFGVRAGPTKPFVRMPITYERAYGGREPDPPANPDCPRFERRNPVGCGFEPIPGRLAPNIAYPNPRLSQHPAGFGPIPPNWSPRIEYAGTYDEPWQKERLPLYPKDLDDRFFLCSPEDQRPRSPLRGGESVELVNMTPGGRLAFVLPRVAFRFETEFQNKPTVIHRGVLHGVILEPDAPRVIMVWQTALPAHADVLRLTQTWVSQLRVINAPPGSVPVGAEADIDEYEGANE